MMKFQIKDSSDSNEIGVAIYMQESLTLIVTNYNDADPGGQFGFGNYDGLVASTHIHTLQDKKWNEEAIRKLLQSIYRTDYVRRTR